MRRRIRGVLALTLVFALVLTCPVQAERVLSSGRTPLDTSRSNNVYNIQLAIASLDGTTVEDGAFFSFNDTVGPRTASYGYKNGINGRGVKIMGGGVAQVATTLYLALKGIPGIQYAEKKAYTTFTDAYTKKANAILVDYKAGTDFSFYNESGQDFGIDMWIRNGYVYCQLVSDDSGGGKWGDGYSEIYLTGSSAQINNIELAAYSIDDTNLQHGQKFSFNDVVGPRTERYGYRRALNGRGVMVVGGGVAQVASAIHMAVKNLDCVEITEKTIYRNYNQDYVSDISDAIALDYGDDIDYVFRYTGYGTLCIYTHVQDDVLICEIYEYY